MLSRKNFDYIRKVLRSKTLSEAADKLFISQPALSQYLKRLEGKLGVEILDREVQPMQLTEHGDVYYRFLLEFVELEDRLHAEFLKTKPRCKISLGLPFNLQPILADKLLTPLINELPQVSFTIRPESSPTLEQAVTNHEIDLAIINCYKNRFDNVNYYELENDYVVFIANRDKYYDKIIGKEKLITDFSTFKSETFYFAEEGYLIHNISKEILQARNFIPDKIIYFSSIETMLYMVKEGEGVTFLPRIFFDNYSHKDKLLALDFDGEPINIPLMIISNKEKHTPEIDETLEIIKKRWSN